MSALTDTFTSIANAIRTKLGVQTTYTPAQMSTAIASIPTQKEEQTKSVTATTSAQTITPDTGKVLSSVTVNPQVHSATYTPTGYSNANDMGAQNNYRYVDTSAYEPTSITPSNSSPVAMSANTGYKPTESGVAIKSYSLIDPNPSGLPDSLTQGSMYKANANCYAIKTYNSTTPSNSSPIALSNKSIHRISGTGYAIATLPTSKTPSDTDPPAVYEGGGWYDITGSDGYLYENKQSDIYASFAPLRAYNTTSYSKHTLSDWTQTTVTGSFYDTNHFEISDGNLIVKVGGYFGVVLNTDRGRTSSGTVTYGGIQMRVNGTTMATAYSSSSSASYRGYYTFAVGDVISIYSRASSTTQGHACVGFFIKGNIGTVS